MFIFTAYRYFYPVTSVDPVSVLITHPTREIEIMWSTTVIEKTIITAK